MLAAVQEDRWMTDEQRALAEFRTTSTEMGLLAEETAERSVHMGREG
jgi:hypothetical protein